MALVALSFDIEPSAYSIVGMGAVLAGLTKAPILGIILPFEMTADYDIILPLTLCVTTAFISSLAINKNR
jgi:CIC family chloride channel protein